MRKELSRQVREQFKRALRERFPGFRNIPSSTPGWPLYELAAAPSMLFFLMLVIFPREDRFTLDAAWTIHGRFPTDLNMLWPRTFPGTAIAKGEARNGDFIFRMPNLWQPRDYSWDLVPCRTINQMISEQDTFFESGIIPPEPSLDGPLGKVPKLVDDAVEKIETFLIPYFDEVAKQHGHAVSISQVARGGGQRGQD